MRFGRSRSLSCGCSFRPRQAQKNSKAPRPSDRYLTSECLIPAPRRKVEISRGCEPSACGFQEYRNFLHRSRLRHCAGGGRVAGPARVPAGRTSETATSRASVESRFADPDVLHSHAARCVLTLHCEDTFNFGITMVLPATRDDSFVRLSRAARAR